MDPQDPKTIDDLVSQLIKNNPGNQPANTQSSTQPPKNLPGMDINTPSAPSSQTYQSSVRTMQSDIEEIKKSQMGVPEKPKLEVKPSLPEFKLPVPPKPTYTPAPVPLPTPVPYVPKPLPPIPPAPTKKEEPKPTSKPAFSIPSTPKVSPRAWLMILGIPLLILAGVGAYLFFANQTPSEVTISPSPEITKTPALSFLELKFGTPSSIVIPIVGMESDLIGSVKAQLNTSLEPGQFRTYKILDNQNVQYDLSSFLGILSPSAANSEAFKTVGWFLVMYGYRSEDGNILNKLFIAAEIPNELLAKDAMLAWEQNGALLEDMSKLFDYDSKLSKTTVLAEDTYNGIKFKYAKLSTRDSGLSYAIFDNTLVIASSRDSFRAALDTLTPAGK